MNTTYDEVNLRYILKLFIKERKLFYFLFLIYITIFFIVLHLIPATYEVYQIINLSKQDDLQEVISNDLRIKKIRAKKYHHILKDRFQEDISKVNFIVYEINEDLKIMLLVPKEKIEKAKRYLSELFTIFKEQDYVYISRCEKKVQQWIANKKYNLNDYNLDLERLQLQIKEEKILIDLFKRRLQELDLLSRQSENKNEFSELIINDKLIIAYHLNRFEMKLINFQQQKKSILNNRIPAAKNKINSYKEKLNSIDLVRQKVIPTLVEAPVKSNFKRISAFIAGFILCISLTIIMANVKSTFKS